ncbi:MAG: hypothetical protein JRN68_09080 [Nitrososphaerota archaeon]|nr:hypothetical protein [Nitrososphaerota archaeon]
MSTNPPDTNQARSFSRIPFTLTLTSGKVVKGELVRHLAPFCIGTMLKMKRLRGFVTKEGNAVVLVSGVTAGLEKPVRRFGRGDVAFLPLDGSIRFILSETDASRPMNHIGNVLSGMEVLDSVNPGETADLLFQQ